MPDIEIYFSVFNETSFTGDGQVSNTEDEFMLQLAAELDRGLNEFLLQVLKDEETLASYLDSLELNVITTIEERTPLVVLLLAEITGTAKFRPSPDTGLPNEGIPTKASLANAFWKFFSFGGTDQLHQYLNSITPDATVMDVGLEINGEAVGTDGGSLGKPSNGTGVAASNGTVPSEAIDSEGTENTADNKRWMPSIALLSIVLAAAAVALLAIAGALFRHTRKRRVSTLRKENCENGTLGKVPAVSIGSELLDSSSPQALQSPATYPSCPETTNNTDNTVDQESLTGNSYAFHEAYSQNDQESLAGNSYFFHEAFSQGDDVDDLTVDFAFE
jgi:hypothetical protein